MICQSVGALCARVASWLHQANPQLSNYITKLLGSDHWLTNLDELAKLRKYADDVKVQERWMSIKQANKVRYRCETHEADTTHGSRLCDCKPTKPMRGNDSARPGAAHRGRRGRHRQFRRALRCPGEAHPRVQAPVLEHPEVRLRQCGHGAVECVVVHLRFLLFCHGWSTWRSVVHRYLKIKGMSAEQRKSVVPRVVIFGGKAAPGAPPSSPCVRVCWTAANGLLMLDHAVVAWQAITSPSRSSS